MQEITILNLHYLYGICVFMFKPIDQTIRWGYEKDKLFLIVDWVIEANRWKAKSLYPLIRISGKILKWKWTNKRWRGWEWIIIRKYWIWRKLLRNWGWIVVWKLRLIWRKTFNWEDKLRWNWGRGKWRW